MGMFCIFPQNTLDKGQQPGKDDGGLTIEDGGRRWMAIGVIWYFYKRKHSLPMEMLQYHVEDEIILGGMLEKNNPENIIFSGIFFYLLYRTSECFQIFTFPLPNAP